MAEYNRQFFPVQFRDDHLRSWDLEGHHYGGLALFYSPDPGPVFLPLRFDSRWLDMQRRHLDWPHVSLHWTAGEAEMCDALAADPATVRLLRSHGEPLVWGETAGAARLRGAVSPAARAGGSAVGQARFESKYEASRRFARCAKNHPEVRLVEQNVYDSVEEATASLTERAAATGRPVMLKSDFGVGGFGTRLVQPQEVSTPVLARALLNELTEHDAVFTVTPLLVEEYVRPRADDRAQLTYDGEITPHGLVDRGTGLMQVEGTHYRGATVGPGVLPDALHRSVTGFGRAVGAQLAEEGYRGWFDVDFVVGRDGRITPTEINSRRTGPSVAMAIAENLAAGGRPVVVRTEDMLPLPRPVPEERLHTFFEEEQKELEGAGVVLIPTLVTASSEQIPYAGFALAAESATAVDAAMRKVGESVEYVARRLS